MAGLTLRFRTFQSGDASAPFRLIRSSLGTSRIGWTMSNPAEQASTKFVERVYAVVRQIPHGRVTTYGRIARFAGAGRSARMVGYALHNCPDDVSENAHRVVNRIGELTGGWSWGHPAIMRGLLEDEGITFVDEYQVDLEIHLWDPNIELTGDQPPPTK
jgi:methylated-DNA-protein-cysteine methyltransferase related protein